MDNKSFDELMNGYINDQLTEEDVAQFLRLLQQEEHKDEFKKYIEQLLKDESISSLSDQNSANIIFQKIMDAAVKVDKVPKRKVIHLKQKPNRSIFIRVAVAASIIGLFFLGSYFWLNRKAKTELAKKEIKKRSFKNDVLPGGDKAILTLADGTQVVLDDAKNGTLTRQGNTKIIKLGGKLSYRAFSADLQEVIYNTISTPRGGQYQIELADGSRVWINAASSLHFPTSFTGKERRVEITGEAYFEVARNKAIRFTVGVNGAEVQVLGTHFNVDAYKDEEEIKTTLLEGSVKFVSGSNSSLLKPGQQSKLAQNGQIKVASGVDIGEVMAWKNGMFQFKNANVEKVMKQLSRWYDVDVVFKSKNSQDEFFIEMSRNSKLSEVLRVLELTGKLKFEIEGKKVVVM